MPRKLKQQAADLDEFDEFSPLKKELAEFVRKLAADALVPITGDRNYILEADGSIFMQYGENKVNSAHWTRFEWDHFKHDMAHGLQQKLAAHAARVREAQKK